MNFESLQVHAGYQPDKDTLSNDPDGGRKGSKAARSIALISYRNVSAYNQIQKEDDDEKLTSFKAASYQVYQGDTLVSDVVRKFWSNNNK